MVSETLTVQFTLTEPNSSKLWRTNAEKDSKFSSCGMFLSERSQINRIARPQSFGKTLFLNTLASYYDILQVFQQISEGTADSLQNSTFSGTFGGLPVAKESTTRNSHVVLHWKFGQVKTTGSFR